MQVLIVDADSEYSSLLARALQLDGHSVSTLGSLSEARGAPFSVIDLVIIDLGLADGSGIELCCELRQRGDTVRILVLTQYTQVDVRVAALEAGADDCVCRPVELIELRARVRALGRRGPILRPPVHLHADVSLDFDGRRATRGGAAVAVTAREWAILDFLAMRSGRFSSRDDLLTAVWGDASDSAGNSLDVLLVRLRRKFGRDIVETMRGHGYALGGTLGVLPK